MQAGRWVIARFHRHANDDFAAMGELDGVADQIDDDLPQPPGIAENLSGTSCSSRGKLHPFLVRASQRFHGVAESVAQIN